jgi:F-type H+-transporting ATPase subunit b
MQLPDLSLLLVMVVFWATYFVLRATIFKPLGAILEEREQAAESADGALRAALERQKETLADIDRRLTAARREAMAVRESATQAAATRRAELLERAKDEARRATEAAQHALEVEIEKARAQLRDAAENTAAEIAAVVLGRRIA